jgi:hypothetical protein
MLCVLVSLSSLVHEGLEQINILMVTDRKGILSSAKTLIVQELRFTLFVSRRNVCQMILRTPSAQFIS